MGGVGFFQFLFQEFFIIHLHRPTITTVIFFIANWNGVKSICPQFQIGFSFNILSLPTAPRVRSVPCISANFLSPFPYFCDSNICIFFINLTHFLLDTSKQCLLHSIICLWPSHQVLFTKNRTHAFRTMTMNSVPFKIFN